MQKEARNALRLASKSGVEIDKENTSTLNKLSAISIVTGRINILVSLRGQLCLLITSTGSGMGSACSSWIGR